MGARGREVRCVETGEVFASIREAARAKGCTAANISKAIAKHGVAVGGHWSYVYRDVDQRERRVREARGVVCLACCESGPMADGSGIKWCKTCPVMRIRTTGPVV